MIQAPQIDMRDRIMNAATLLFADRGFEGTSIQSVADAVGIRKPSLLYHFPSKDALRAAVLDDLLAHWKRELPSVLASATTGKDRFEGAIKAIVDFFVAQPVRARLIAREMMDQPDVARRAIGEHIAPWTGLVTDYIRLGQESGRLRQDVDPEAYVTQVVTLAIGTVALGGVTQSLIGSGATMPQQLEEMVRIARVSLFKSRPKES